MDYPEYDLYGVLGYDPDDPTVYEIDELSIRRLIRSRIAETQDPADRLRLALATRVLGNSRTRKEYDDWRRQLVEQPELASSALETPLPAPPTVDYSTAEEHDYAAQMQRMLGPHWQSHYPEFRSGRIRYQLSELRDRFSLAMDTRSGRMQSTTFRWQQALDARYWRYRTSFENRYWDSRYGLEQRRDRISWWLEENPLRWVLVALVPVMVVLVVLLALDLLHIL